MSKLNWQRLHKKFCCIAYPHKPHRKGKFLDGPPPDSVYIAHQALTALGAHVIFLDTKECQKKILSDSPPEFVLEISGFSDWAAYEGLLGSMCNAYNIAYFPSKGLPQIIASDKLLSKKYAAQAGLHVPKTIVCNNEVSKGIRLIRKPICGAESFGVDEVGQDALDINNSLTGFFVEEYISGVDLTFLAIKNPKNGNPEIIAALENQDLSKSDITTNEVKKLDLSIYGSSLRYRNSILQSLPFSLINKVKKFVVDIGLPPISRLDFRMDKLQNELFYFLEVNTDPTIGANQIWYDPIKNWWCKEKPDEIFCEIDDLAIHPSAKVMAYLISVNHV